MTAVLPADDLLEQMERETAAVFDDLRARSASGDRPLRLRSLAELLADPDSLKPPEAIVPRLAYRGRVTLVVGREKLGGKSTLLTAGAAAVTRGADFLGERCVAGEVLWISSDQEHQNEIVQRAVRFGADPDRFHVLWPTASLADLTAAIERLDPTPVIVVVDTLANFARGLVDDPGSSAQWPAVIMPLVTLARDGNLAVEISAHAKKGETGGYRDSSAIGASVDMILELQPDAGNLARRNVTVLGRWPAPNFAVELVGDRYQISAGEVSLDVQILLYVQANPRCSKNQVRGSVGGRGEEVDTALGRLLKSQAIRNVGNARGHAYEATQGPAGCDPGTAQELDAIPF